MTDKFIRFNCTMETKVSSKRKDIIQYDEYLTLGQSYSNPLEFYGSINEIIDEVLKIFKKTIYKDTKNEVHFTFTSNSSGTEKQKYRFSVYTQYTEFIDDKDKHIKKYNCYYSFDGSYENQKEISYSSKNIMEEIESYVNFGQLINKLINE